MEEFFCPVGTWKLIWQLTFHIQVLVSLLSHTFTTSLNLKIEFTHTSAFNSPISDFVINYWLFKVSVWRIPDRGLVSVLLTPQGVENWCRKTVIFLVIQIQPRHKILLCCCCFFVRRRGKESNNRTKLKSGNLRNIPDYVIMILCLL